MRIKTIGVISAIPASGKTKAILSSVRTATGKIKPTIVASITKELSHQSYEYYMTNMFDPTSDSPADVVIIDSDNSNRSTVAKIIAEAIERQTKIIFITHTALLQMASSTLEQCSKYDLYIDETPTLVDFKQFSLETDNFNDVVLRHCELVESDKVKLNLLKIKDGQHSRINEIIELAENQHDDIHTLLLPIYKALVNNQAVLVNTSLAPLYKLFVLEDIGSVDSWDNFKSVTVAAANFMGSFDRFILQARGWAFKDSRLNSKLDFKKYKNTKRVTINVMSESFWSKSGSEKIVEFRGRKIKVFEAITTVINENLKSSRSPCIYTTNSYRSASLYRGANVKYNPHGINSYMGYTAAAVLFSYNPFPWQVPVMKAYAEFSGFDPDEFVTAYRVSKYLEPAFQLCARTNIRDNSSNAKIELYVPDMELAMYIKSTYLADALIFKMYEQFDVTPKKVRKPRTKGVTKRMCKSFQTVLNMTQPEKSKFGYMRSKYLERTGDKLDINNRNHIEYVKAWLKALRSERTWS